MFFLGRGIGSKQFNDLKNVVKASKCIEEHFRSAILLKKEIWPLTIFEKCFQIDALKPLSHFLRDCKVARKMFVNLISSLHWLVLKRILLIFALARSWVFGLDVVTCDNAVPITVDLLLFQTS